MKNVKQVQWFDSHFYKVGEEFYPSVTTKLNAESKPFLARWRGNVGNREADKKMRESADRGSRIHHAWECYYNNIPVYYNPPLRPNYADEEIKEGFTLQNQDEMYDLYKLEQWHKEVNPELLANETIVYSDKWREAGQLDKVFDIKEGIYMINGAKPLKLEAGIYVADLKTGAGVGSAEEQIAAYAAMYEEIHEVKVKGGLIVHTGAKTKSGLATKLIDNLDYHYETYRVIANLWERKFGTKNPKVFEFPSMIKL